MRKFWTIVLVFVFAALVQPSLHAHEQKGAHACKKCDMKFSDADKKFSVTVSQGIEFSEFDDIGCAMVWKYGECAMRQDAFDNYAVAHDYETGEQVPVQKALFVVESGVKTPMGYGVIAFKTKEQAEKLVAELKKGKVIKYADLDAMKWK